MLFKFKHIFILILFNRYFCSETLNFTYWLKVKNINYKSNANIISLGEIYDIHTSLWENETFFLKFTNSTSHLNKNSKDKTLEYPCIIRAFDNIVICNITDIQKQSLLKIVYGNYLTNIEGHSITISKFKPKKMHKLYSVLFIFAGRKDYLSVQRYYLERLIKSGDLSEVHYWDFTNNPYELEYLHNVSNIHRTSSNFNEYLEIFPEIIKGKWLNISVKAEKQAFIRINDEIEIELGAYNNTKIRVNSTDKEVYKNFEEGVLDNANFVDFNISFNDKDIILKFKYKSVEKEAYFKSILINEAYIKKVEIHTGKGVIGEWDYFETKNIGFKLMDTENRKSWNAWDECYLHYANKSFDILLKSDDDVVFIDTRRFYEFILFVYNNPQYSVVFPNLVNHDFSLYYNAFNDLIPDNLFTELKNVNRKIDLFSTFFSFYRENQIIVFRNGTLASNLHKHFLSNFDKYINNDFDNVIIYKFKFRICFFASTQKNFNIIFGNTKFAKEFKIGDEPYLNNKFFNKILYSRFIVIHYQFSPQMKSGLDKRYITAYRALAKREDKRIINFLLENID